MSVISLPWKKEGEVNVCYSLFLGMEGEVNVCYSLFLGMGEGG